MVIKGSARGSPAGLAKHLDRADTNERVELKEIRGVAAQDLDGALREMDAQGAALRTTRTLYHASINVPVSERMSDEQRAHAVDQLEASLGLTGQPRAVVEHEKKGRVHVHAVWARTDLEHMRAIRCDHNYRVHEQVARGLEREFGHAHVQGAHVGREGQDGDRKPRPARTPSHAEMQQAERTGLTPQEAKQQITALWRATDSGKAFAAAIHESGWVLTRGEKRDFVLIDRAGEVHSLARRIDGAKAKDVRERMADIDRASLPTAEQGKAIQRERTREAAQREMTIPAATIEQAPAIERAQTPAPAASTERPLSKTAGEIHMARSLTRSGQGFAAALEDRGLILASVSAEEASRTVRVSAFAKETGNFAPRFKEGELVVLDAKGGAYQLTQRSMGMPRAEIDKYLATIDRAPLMTMTGAREVFRDVRREQFIAGKQAARPATKMETQILAAFGASKDGPTFVGELNKHGVSLAKVTAGDITQQSFRQAAPSLTRTAAQQDRRALLQDNKQMRRSPALKVGELVAVNRHGGIYRLNPHKITGEIEARAAHGRQLGSAFDVRTAKLDERALHRAERQIARNASIDSAAQARAVRGVAKEVQAVGKAVVNTAVTVAKIEAITAEKGKRAGSRLLKGIGSVFSTALDAVLSVFDAKPPPSPEQQREDARAIAQARAQEERAAREAKRDADRAARREEYRTQTREKEHEAAQRKRYEESREHYGGRERER